MIGVWNVRATPARRADGQLRRGACRRAGPRRNRRVHARDDVEQRGLAAAIRPDQPGDLDRARPLRLTPSSARTAPKDFVTSRTTTGRPRRVSTSARLVRGGPAFPRPARGAVPAAEAVIGDQAPAQLRQTAGEEDPASQQDHAVDERRPVDERARLEVDVLEDRAARDGTVDAVGTADHRSGYHADREREREYAGRDKALAHHVQSRRRCRPERLRPRKPSP